MQCKKLKNMSKIAVLLSGGVDSAVAAQILYNDGIDFDLFHLIIGQDDCNHEEDREMATAVARKFGKKLNFIDLNKEYNNNIIEYIIEHVKKGLTPNPDVMCNRLIKFGAFNEKTNNEYDKIATGHYAVTYDDEDARTWLGTAVDKVKDQTDFLANMKPKQISKALFPIGKYSKNEVRLIADKYKLAPSHRKDSQGLCFLGKINYNDFITKYLGKYPGKIVEFETGKILGSHNGYWFHTIGQRKGLGLSGGPWYVCKKDIDENIVYVTCNHELFEPNEKTIIYLGNRDNFNWTTIDPFPSNEDNIWNNINTCPTISFKIRHSPNFTKGKLCNNKGNLYIKNFSSVGGIAPGQFCILYDEFSDICFGCSEIKIN